METQIYKPEDFKDKGFFHKHALLGALFFLILLAGVALAIYLATPSDSKCKNFGVKCAQAPATTQNETQQNICIEGTKPEDCNDMISEVNEWKTYKNEEYGFEVQLPKNWTVREEINPTKEPGIFLQPVNNDPNKFHFMILPHAGYDYGIPFEEPVESKMEINEVETQITLWDLENSSELKWVHFTETPTSWKSNLNRIDILTTKELKFTTDQILSTFKFTEPIPADSKTYKNDEYKFEFNYPKSHCVLDDKTTLFVSEKCPVTKSDLDGPGGFPRVKGNFLYIKDQSERTTKQGLKTSRNGIDVYHYNFKCEDGSMCGYSDLWYFEDPSKKYVFEIMNNGESVLIDQILSTFKFIE